MNIGERIKQRREELGISVDEVAKRLGKHRATVYRYESNEIGTLPTSVLEPLAVVLCTTPAALMGWEDFQPQQSATVSDKEAEIAAIMYSVMGDKDPEFCRRFSAALARLDESGWELIEKMVMKLAGEDTTRKYEQATTRMKEPVEELTTEEEEALYRSHYGIVENTTSSALNTTGGTESSGAKLA